MRECDLLCRCSKKETAGIEHVSGLGKNLNE